MSTYDQNDTGNTTAGHGRSRKASEGRAGIRQADKGGEGRAGLPSRLRKDARRDRLADAGRPRHTLSVPALKRETATIVATLGKCDRYVVDADGNVYSRLKEQGVAGNPRFHLWLDEQIVKVYKRELRKAAVSATE